MIGKGSGAREARGEGERVTADNGAFNARSVSSDKKSLFRSNPHVTLMETTPSLHLPLPIGE